MKAFVRWLLGKSVLYLAIVAAIAFSIYVLPSFRDEADGWLASPQERAAELDALAREGRTRLDAAKEEARTGSDAALRDRLTGARTLLADAEARRQGAKGPLAVLRPRERARAELDIAVATREIALIETALSLDDRVAALAEEGPGRIAVPTRAAIEQRKRQCLDATRAVNDRNIVRQTVDVVRQRDEALRRRAQTACQNAREAETARRVGLAKARAIRAGRASFAQAEEAAQLPVDLFAAIDTDAVREVLRLAALALLAIVLVPYAIRLVFFFVLAPLAGRRAPIRLASETEGGAMHGPIAAEAASAPSISVTLAPGEDLLVRQDFLQSRAGSSTARTRWLLDWRHPVTSLASGMRFLIQLSGDSRAITISPARDAVAEVRTIAIPAGSACVLRPRAIAALVQQRDRPVRITSHWRLFSLHAWLTGQLRYLAFHGPVRVVLTGGRGVRVEPAEEGRVFDPGQLAGFTTDLAYSATRTETFWPYFLGRESLMKDRVAGAEGTLIVEEAPLAGRSGGVRGGLEGMVDAALKAVGI